MLYLRATTALVLPAIVDAAVPALLLRGSEASVELGAWAVLGAVLAPALLRRMANRQSGSQVAAAREAAAQWTR